jgi:2-methylcitrate dehydratase PrpD
VSERPEDLAIERAVEVGKLVPEAAGRAMADGFTVALAGTTQPELAAFGATVTAGTAGPKPGVGLASRWFTGGYLTAAQAAMLNGAAIHAFDFDDTHDAAIVHCMAAILPAAMAGAESAVTPGNVAAAVAAGTELACNLALSRGHYAGWHYTTVCGTLGAALAAAVAGGATPVQQADAVGNAYVFACGNKQVVLDSSLMKRLMPGFAAHTGVLAMQAATAGLGGVRDWLTGRYGLGALFYEGDYDFAPLAGGARPRVAELSYKPYPACRFTHGAIEAALNLRDRIEPPGEVVVHYPDLDRFGIVCRPYERRGAGVMDAQFSTAYLVASVLLRGEIGFDSYTDEALADAQVEALAEKVTVLCDLPPDGPDSLGPIEVHAAGQVERVDTVLGSPERPMDGAEAARKFAVCAAAAGSTLSWIDLTDTVARMAAGAANALDLGGVVVPSAR